MFSDKKLNQLLLTYSYTEWEDLENNDPAYFIVKTKLPPVKS